MTTITCRIPSELDAWLETEARRRRVPKSVLVRRAIEQAARAGAAVRRGPSAYDVARHLCGSLKGGPRDLASNPRYLEGFGE
jgi:predicted transcriptional regulator